MDLYPRSGLLYGEIYVEGVDIDIVLPAQDVYYQINAWSEGPGHDGEFNGVESEMVNDRIPIKYAGRYMVTWTASSYSAAKNEYEYEIHVNDGSKDFENTEGYRTTSVASAVGNSSGGGICNFAVGDTVELWVKRLDGGDVSPKTLTIRQARITVVKMGGVNVA